MRSAGYLLRLFFLSLFFIYHVSFAQVSVDIEALRDYIEEARIAWNVPGMSVGVVYQGEIAFAEGFGQCEVANKEKGKVDENTLFAIASNTKAFIGTALSMLVEEGKLSWQDKVRDHLPYFALYDPYVSENVRVEDLLCHRVGLGTFSGDVIWYKSDYTAEEVVKRIRHVPQAYGFRDGYGYSNLMFITAGELIRAVSGQSWAEYIQAHILTPLQMQRTQTSVSPLAKMENVATPHKPVAGKNQAIPYANWDNMGAAGGIISSAADMSQWLLLQLNEGVRRGDTMFREAAQYNMWHPHNSLYVSPGYKARYPHTNFRGYGLGWSLSDYHGHKVVAHGGGYDGMYSRVMMVPDAELGIVILTNSMKGISTYLANYITDQYLGVKNPQDWKALGLASQERGDAFRANRVQQRHDARMTDTKPALKLVSYTGTYHSEMYGNIIIKPQGDGFRMELPHAPSLNATLSHWHYDTYLIEWDETHAWFDFGTLSFVIGNNGIVTGATFDVPNDDIFFEEIELVRVP
ncbi:MAG: serine hydrolase [Bacteroidota bacterium]